MPTISEIDSLKKEVDQLKDDLSRSKGRLEQLKKTHSGDPKVIQAKLEKLNKELVVKKKKFDELLAKYTESQSGRS